MRNKKHILIIIAISLTSIFVVRWLLLNIFIIPRWIPKSISEILCVELNQVGDNSTSESVTIKNTEQIEQLYNLINSTKIKKLDYSTGHSYSDWSDAPITIIFVFKDNTTIRFMIEGVRNNGNIIKDQRESDLFWTYGKRNDEIAELLRHFLSERVNVNK